MGVLTRWLNEGELHYKIGNLDALMNFFNSKALEENDESGLLCVRFDPGERPEKYKKVQLKNHKLYLSFLSVIGECHVSNITRNSDTYECVSLTYKEVEDKRKTRRSLVHQPQSVISSLLREAI